jgi:hypothetical protein
MIYSQISNNTILGKHDIQPPKSEVSRLLTAAVINTQFRSMLLNNPSKAISKGYGGERFQLCKEEQTKLASIKAASLAEFAWQVND